MSSPKPKSGSSQGLRAWLREYVRPLADSRVSHTKVQVLSKPTRDPWPIQSVQKRNIQSPWKRIPDIRGEVKGNATKLETFELSKQNGAKETSNAPVCSGTSSRNSRSFRRALLGSRGNRRTAKVAPLPIDNSEQNGTLKTSNAPTFSGKLPKEFGSLLPRFPTKNQSTGRSTPTPVSASKYCMSNDDLAQKRITRDLILCDLHEETILKKPTEIPLFEIVGNGLLPGKNEAGKRQEKKLLGKKFEAAKRSRGLKNQINKGGRRGTGQNERSNISLDHGDNKTLTSPGFLLHSKPRRRAASPSRRGRHVQDVDSIQPEPPPYSWTSKSSMYDIWEGTKEREGGNQLVDGDSEDGLTYSWMGQEVWSAESFGCVGRSLTMKPKWFADFKNTRYASKMYKPKTRRGRAANEATGNENFDFLSHDKCNDKIDTVRGAPAIAQHQPLRDLKVGSGTEDFDIWRNNFEENKTPEEVILEEEEDSIQYFVGSPCQSLVFDTCGGDRYEENTIPETVDREESLKPLSEHKDQETIAGKPLDLVNQSDIVNQAWFIDHNSKNDETNMMARPKTNRGRVVKGSVNKNSPAKELEILTREKCDGHKNNGPHGGIEVQRLFLRDQKKQLNVDIWKNDVEDGEDEALGKFVWGANDATSSVLGNGDQVSKFDSEESMTDVNTCEEEDDVHDIYFDECQKEEEEEQELTITELEKLNENQKEQWELAALGEWSLICHDDEDDEESTNRYFMINDELQKEQEVGEHLMKSIICEFQELQVIKDFQKMLTVPGCPKGQVGRALGHYARICHGPVPLTISGQSKAEAVASLSVNLRHRTKHFHQDQLFSFKEFASVLEELDTLRDRQDSVEDSLKRNLRKEEARRRKVQASYRRRQIPRWAPSGKLFQWEIDMTLMETYYFDAGKIKSSCRIDVMSCILE
ncbi:uncharacterized protein [Asterias amurensis]|uniref:uncharacterized protein n=1 Tax=Asterias amurensis TaxID=7602 RepID=UPI003AB7B131